MSTAPDPKAGLSELADLLVGIETYENDAPIRDALVLTAMAQAYACGFKVGVSVDFGEPEALIVLPTGLVSWPLPSFSNDYPTAAEVHDRCAAFIAEHYQETTE